MKILKIIHCFPPESMTGSEIYAYNLAKELSRNNRVSVFYRINNPCEKEYKVLKGEYNGLTVYKINNTLKDCNSLENIYNNRNIEEAFAAILDELKPDIVHIHHLLFLSVGIIEQIKRRNIPIIFTLHDYWLICPRGQLFKANLKICDNPVNSNCLYCLGAGLSLKRLMKKIFWVRSKISFSRRFSPDLQNIVKNVDLFISPSHFLRNKFIKSGIPEEKIIYSDNGMNLSFFNDIEKIKSDKIRFGFIGTLIPPKGVHILIEAFNKLKGDKAVLKIYGKSPVNNGFFDYYHKVKRMAAGNKNIRFMDVFDNKDVAKIFKEIDVLIFPSLWEENSPLVLHEAILAKTPAIASSIGGVDELIDNNNGLLFQANDSKGLFVHMKNIIVNPKSLNEFNKSSVGIKDIKNNAEEMENIYVKKINR